MKKVLVAGASGYLGKHLLKELKKRGYYTIALARTPGKLDGIEVDKILMAEVTKPETLSGIYRDVDYNISTVGITRQKDGLTYMEVDYQANMNLLEEALKSNMKKFIYVSVLNGRSLKNLKIVEAKERFVEALQSSGINYTVIRANGFFSDMEEVLKMAQKGKVRLFGDGHYRSNPIHGADLAEFIVNHLGETKNQELDIGGPDLMTQNEIAEAAFRALGKPPKISYIPIWIRNLALGLIRFFTGQKIYGPVEFFMTVATRDMVAPQIGKYHLNEYYQDKVSSISLEVNYVKV